MTPKNHVAHPRELRQAAQNWFTVEVNEVPTAFERALIASAVRTGRHVQVLYAPRAAKEAHESD